MNGAGAVSRGAGKVGQGLVTGGEEPRPAGDRESCQGDPGAVLWEQQKEGSRQGSSVQA